MTRLIVLLAAVLAGCDPHPAPVAHPVRPSKATTTWAEDVRRVARDGDWILIRTHDGDPSSAALYDASRDTVVGGREMSLSHYVANSTGVLVVRPYRMTSDDQRAALLRARGMTDEVDGSIVVFLASQTGARNGAYEPFVTPATLVKYGAIIWYR